MEHQRSEQVRACESITTGAATRDGYALECARGAADRTGASRAVPNSTGTIPNAMHLAASERTASEDSAGKFRGGCLKEIWFLDLTDAGQRVEEWRVDYNEVRPHSSLDNRTPME